MRVELTELEQEFRQSWSDFDPQRYAVFLDKAPLPDRLELLVRLLSAELEFVFQPPNEGPRSSQSVTPEDERIRPCVRLFLHRFPELETQPDFVIRLAVLEYALRLRHDADPPDPESYLTLCDPAQERLIKLLELTEQKLPARRYESPGPAASSPSDSTVNELDVSASITLEPLPLNLGCFLLIRLIGKGGMGYVHAAIDLRSTAQVAVKVMRRVDAWSIYRFIEEFSWLSRLSHPNLVKLYDAFCDDEIRYFSMELVEGRTIREWFTRFSAHEDLRWRELRHVLKQFASALQYLHDHAVVHCDIKSSNMMITRGRRAVLLDLGLAVRAGQENRFVGTLQYMAPEVLMGGCADISSDWYSFGVMIFEVVTGGFPPVQIDMSREDPLGRYTIDLEQLNDRLRSCPTDVMELCLELLQFEPERRPLGAAVVSRLGGQQESYRPFVSQLECAGREAELQQLHSAITASSDDVPSLIMLHGESGIGKSTLMQFWMKNSRPTDCLLISLRCYRQDHTPVRLLNSLVQELLSATSHLSPEVWRSSLEASLKQMCVVFPQVQQILEKNQTATTQDRSTARPQATREESILSLLNWLVQLSHERRVVICVDDGQWADQESLQALYRLLSHEDRFQGCILLAEESDDSRSVGLQTLSNSAGYNPKSQPFRAFQIALEPLAEDTCKLLLTGWAAKANVALSSSTAKEISVHSGGNPFLLLELFRAYLHYLRRQNAGDENWLVPDSHAHVSRRFGMLPMPAENILQFLAVADQAIGFHQLQMVSRVLPHELQRTLSYLASQGWIRSGGSSIESDTEIAHENFRRVVLQSIPKERLRRRHFRMARILSSENPPPWARIAAHYWSADRFREAATCYLQAARGAMDASAFQEAVFFLERANHPEAERTRQEQRAVLEMKADCLASIGSSRAAAELYDRLLEEFRDAPSDHGERKRVGQGTLQQETRQAIIDKCRSGEQWIRAGQLELGLTRLKDALEQLGVAHRRRTWFSRFCLQCRTAHVSLRVPDWRPIPDGQQPAEKSFSEMEKCLNRVASPLTFLDNQLGLDLILRLAKLADDHGSTVDRSLASMRCGILLSFGGKKWRARALAKLRLGRRMARSSRSSDARAASDFCMAVWNIQRGRVAKALRYSQAAIEKYDANAVHSAQWERQFLQWTRLACYWSSNQLRTLQQQTAVLRASAHRRSDPMSMFLMHVGAAHWSDLASDDTVQARRSLEIAGEAIANQTFQSPRYFLWLSKIKQALYEDDDAGALQLLEQDWKQLDQSLVLSTKHYRWLALSVRICCALVAVRNHPKKRHEWARDAQKNVKLMLQLEEPAFIEYGRAFALVVDGLDGVVAPPQVWQASIKRLQACGHQLMALALHWHQSMHFSEDQSRWGGHSEAEHTLRCAGCMSPEKLLNMVLPLPHLATK